MDFKTHVNEDGGGGATDIQAATQQKKLAAGLVEGWEGKVGLFFDQKFAGG